MMVELEQLKKDKITLEQEVKFLKQKLKKKYDQQKETKSTDEVDDFNALKEDATIKKESASQGDQRSPKTGQSGLWNNSCLKKGPIKNMMGLHDILNNVNGGDSSLNKRQKHDNHGQQISPNISKDLNEPNRQPHQQNLKRNIQALINQHSVNSDSNTKLQQQNTNIETNRNPAGNYGTNCQLQCPS